MYTIAQYFPENVLIDNAMAVILVVLFMPCAWNYRRILFQNDKKKFSRMYKIGYVIIKIWLNQTYQIVKVGLGVTYISRFFAINARILCHLTLTSSTVLITDLLVPGDSLIWGQVALIELIYLETKRAYLLRLFLQEITIQTIALSNLWTKLLPRKICTFMR